MIWSWTSSSLLFIGLACFLLHVSHPCTRTHIHWSVWYSSLLLTSNTNCLQHYIVNWHFINLKLVFWRRRTCVLRLTPHKVVNYFKVMISISLVPKRLVVSDVAYWFNIYNMAQVTLEASCTYLIVSWYSSNPPLLMCAKEVRCHSGPHMWTGVSFVNKVAQAQQIAYLYVLEEGDLYSWANLDGLYQHPCRSLGSNGYRMKLELKGVLKLKSPQTFLLLTNEDCIPSSSEALRTWKN